MERGVGHKCDIEGCTLRSFLGVAPNKQPGEEDKAPEDTETKAERRAKMSGLEFCDDGRGEEGGAEEGKFCY